MCDLKQTERGAVPGRKGSNPTSVRAQQTLFHSVSYDLPISFHQLSSKNKHHYTKSNSNYITKSDLAYSQVTSPRFTGLDHCMPDNTVEESTHKHHTEDNCTHTAYCNEQNYIWQVFNSRN